jgi:hypothetical protein
LYKYINEFKKGYWLRDAEKGEKGDLPPKPHSTSNRLKALFCQLLYVHGVN